MRNNNKNDRLRIFVHRKKSNDYTLHVTVVILIVLGLLGSRSPNAFKSLPSYQMRDDSTTPAFQDDGPSVDGTTILTVTNAVPHPLVFAVQQKKQKKESTIEPCQNCRIYNTDREIPNDVCKSGTATTIAVQPGENHVHWYYQNANIGEINANWNLPPGRKYSICLVMNLSKGRSNWDSK